MKFYFSNEDGTNLVYSDDHVQHVISSVPRDILKNSGSQEAIEYDITRSNDVLIDGIECFTIKNTCQEHLCPFAYRNLLPPSSCMYFDYARKQPVFAKVYPSGKDVICKVLNKICHIPKHCAKKSIRDSIKGLLEISEKLIYLITKEFSKAQVAILENTKKILRKNHVYQQKVEM